MSAFIIKFGLVLLVAVVVGGMVWRTVGRGKPNTVRGFPDRQRLPRMVAIIGAVFTVIGTMMVLAAFTTGGLTDLLPLRIAAVVVLATGILFLVGYRNRYVAPGTDAVRFRTLLGREGDSLRGHHLVSRRHRQRQAAVDPSCRTRLPARQPRVL